VLLDAGADPARYRNDDGQPAPAVSAALPAGCDLEVIELLLAHGADPDAPGPDGRAALRDLRGERSSAVDARQQGWPRPDRVAFSKQCRTIPQPGRPTPPGRS
jgi:hypothetical protein